MKPYYCEGGITIYHGDCREILPQVKASITITDPPYNVGKDYGTHNDSMNKSAYLQWLASIFEHCATDDVVYFPGNVNLFDAPAILREGGRRPVRVLGWHKIEFAGDLWSSGPAISWEAIVWGSRTERPEFNRLFGHDGRDFLLVRSIHGDPFKGPHPCPKPSQVMRWLVGLFAPRNGTVLDPFAGTGTTLCAAQRAGCAAIGIEIEERYCELAANRLSQGVLELAEQENISA